MLMPLAPFLRPTRSRRDFTTLLKLDRKAILALLTFLLTTLVTPGARAAPFGLTDTGWEGASEFVQIARNELGAARVTTTSVIDFSKLRPDDGLLLLYPERPLDAEPFANFMRAGGRVVLLDDFGRSESLLRAFNMKRVPVPRQPAEALRQNPGFALAESASAHPVVSGISRVVTNHATGLQHPDLSPILKIRGAGDEPEITIAVAGTVGEGRLLVVGDPSTVMNSMLKYAGNDALARGLLHYAVDSASSSTHAGRLIIATGNFDVRGRFGESDTALDEFVHDVRVSLEQVRQEGLPDIFTWGAAMALGLGLLVWIGAHAGRLHRALQPRFVRRIPLVAQGGVAGHAAVVGAPRTTRLLALLELKSALVEQLTALLRLDDVPSQKELIARVGDAGLLDAEGLRTLSQLLLRMSNVETMVLVERKRGIVKSVRDEEVLALDRTVRDLVASARQRAEAKQGTRP